MIFYSVKEETVCLCVQTSEAEETRRSVTDEV